MTTRLSARTPRSTYDGRCADAGGATGGALEYLAAPELASSPDAAVWRVFAHAALGDWQGAHANLGRAQSVTANYPVKLQVRFNLAAAKTHLELGNFGKALALCRRSSHRMRVKSRPFSMICCVDVLRIFRGALRKRWMCMIWLCVPARGRKRRKPNTWALSCGTVMA